MPAPTPPQSFPTHARTGKAPGHSARLPWWAWALPVTAFAVLLCLQITGGGGNASEIHSQQLAYVMERVQQALMPS